LNKKLESLKEDYVDLKRIGEELDIIEVRKNLTMFIMELIKEAEQIKSYFN
jgi:hypothetical protein